MAEHKSVFIISDSTGETAYHVLQTVLAQFNSENVRVKRFADVNTPQQIYDVIEEVAQAEGLVFHTLVSPGLREAVTYLCKSRGIRCVDVLGMPIERLSGWLDQKPRYEAGLTRKLDESYSKRVLALEFALRHDDGESAPGLPQADIVVVGISQTAKTPLSISLAYRALLVGNVPISAGAEPQPILFELPKEKIIALTIQPDRLSLLRETRQGQNGVKTGPDNLAEVQNEVNQALALYEREGWRVLDMTSVTVEEAADEILAGVKVKA